MDGKRPIDILLDQIEWKPIVRDLEISEDNEDLPYATHEGIFYIGDFQMRAYKLSNGQRVIHKEDVDKFLGVEIIEEMKGMK